MNGTRLDHIVVAALDLEEGADYVESVIGVRVPDGGQHTFMGTHNKVMALGESVYLEIIAVDPSLNAPDRPRWFGLDDPAMIASLQSSPRLITWAVNTGSLERLLDAATLGVGQPYQAQRNDLLWLVALSDDGRASAGGFFPLCIEWQTDFHPASRMQDLGCRINNIELHHPRADWLTAQLSAIGAADLVKIQPCGESPDAGFLRITFDTPTGVATLDSHINLQKNFSKRS